jgi:hypothetical protein
VCFGVGVGGGGGGCGGGSGVGGGSGGGGGGGGGGFGNGGGGDDDDGGSGGGGGGSGADGAYVRAHMPCGRAKRCSQQNISTQHPPLCRTLCSVTAVVIRWGFTKPNDLT